MSKMRRRRAKHPCTINQGATSCLGGARNRSKQLQNPSTSSIQSSIFSWSWQDLWAWECQSEVESSRQPWAWSPIDSCPLRTKDGQTRTSKPKDPSRNSGPHDSERSAKDNCCGSVLEARCPDCERDAYCAGILVPTVLLRPFSRVLEKHVETLRAKASLSSGLRPAPSSVRARITIESLTRGVCLAIDFNRTKYCWRNESRCRGTQARPEILETQGLRHATHSSRVIRHFLIAILGKRAVSESRWDCHWDVAAWGRTDFGELSPKRLQHVHALTQRPRTQRALLFPVLHIRSAIPPKETCRSTSCQSGLRELCSYQTCTSIHSCCNVCMSRRRSWGLLVLNHYQKNVVRNASSESWSEGGREDC